MGEALRLNIIVTGANRGLGRAIATVLAQEGHRVLLTARDLASGDAAADGILEELPAALVDVMQLDLASLASVRAFGAQYVSRGEALNVLIHNAGVMQQSPTRRMTADGLEETLATNVLGPFLLTRELLPALMRQPRARVVVVSSRLHLPGSRGAPVDFDFDDPNLSRGYDHERAYKNSKLADVWFAYELDRRLSARGVTVNAVCPGFVPVTAAASTRGLTRFMLRYVLPWMPFAQSVEAASRNVAWVATSSALEGVGGRFFAERKPVPSSPDAQDVDKARRFWELACRLVSVPDWPAGSDGEVS